MRQCVLSVVESYIKTMLDSVDVVVASDGSVDDPLDDEGSLKEQMDRLPVIARLQYEDVAQYLLSLFEQALSQYDQLINLPSMQSPSSGGNGHLQAQLQQVRRCVCVRVRVPSPAATSPCFFCAPCCVW